MAHGFFSIFIQHTVKQQRPFAHTGSPDKIQHGTHTLITIISLLAAERLLDLMRRDYGLAKPNSRSACNSAGV